MANAIGRIFKVIQKTNVKEDNSELISVRVKTLTPLSISLDDKTIIPAEFITISDSIDSNKLSINDILLCTVFNNGQTYYIQEGIITKNVITKYSDSQSIDKELSEINTQITNIKKDLTNTNSNINTIIANIKTINSNITTVNKNIDAVSNNLNNTNKQVSSLSEDLKTTTSNLSNKVDKEVGKGLSSNDFTNTIKENVEKNTQNRHSHNNKTVLDNTTASFTEALALKLNNIAENATKTVEKYSGRINAHDVFTMNIPNPIMGFICVRVYKDFTETFRLFSVLGSNGYAFTANTINEHNYNTASTITIEGSDASINLKIVNDADNEQSYDIHIINTFF